LITQGINRSARGLTLQRYCFINGAGEMLANSPLAMVFEKDDVKTIEFSWWHQVRSAAL